MDVPAGLVTAVLSRPERPNGCRGATGIMASPRWQVVPVGQERDALDGHQSG